MQPTNQTPTNPTTTFEASAELKDLAAALSKAQGDIKGAKKDTLNPHFGKKYADLGSVWDVVREPLSKNGLSISQFPYSTESGVGITSILLHTSGQWMKTSLLLYPQRTDPQGMGSAISYARRYSLASIMGVYQEDDDAESATDREAAKPTNKNPEALPGTVDKVAVKDGEVWVQVDGKTLLSTTEPNMSRLLDAEGKKFEFLVTDSGRKAKGKPIYVIHSIFAIPEGANA
jgi:hypothetical protein